jgi:hypothetical protein
MAKLMQKLNDIMSSIQPMEKLGLNTFSNYKYLSDEQIIMTVRKELCKNGVHMIVSTKDAMIVEAVCKMTRVYVEVKFFDVTDGECITVQGIGDGADKGDKGIYKAITGAVKYVLIKNFMLPTGDDPEVNSEHDKPSRSKLDVAAEILESILPNSKRKWSEEQVVVLKHYTSKWVDDPEFMVSVCLDKSLVPPADYDIATIKAWCSSNASLLFELHKGVKP